MNPGPLQEQPVLFSPESFLQPLLYDSLLLCPNLSVLLQIYNEVIRDLLNQSSGFLELREDSRGSIQIAGITEVSTSNAQEVRFTAQPMKFSLFKFAEQQPTGGSKPSCFLASGLDLRSQVSAITYASLLVLQADITCRSCTLPSAARCRNPLLLSPVHQVTTAGWTPSS